MLRQALTLPGPSAIRFPKTPAHQAPDGVVGSGLCSRLVRHGDGSVCILAVGKMLEAAEEAAGKLAGDGVDATVWDVRVVTPADPAMLADAAEHGLVVTVEDGVRAGGAGAFLVDAMRSASTTLPRTPVRVLGTPRSYVPQGKPDAILSDLGLDGPGIAATVLEALAVERRRAEPPSQSPSQ